MTIRTILVSIDGSDACGATLEQALMVAGGLGVHVDVLHVRPDSLLLPPIGDGMTSTMADRVSAKADSRSDARAAVARQVFDDVTRRMGVAVVDEKDDAAPVRSGVLSASWIERTGRRHAVMGRLGRVHDLIVIGHPSNAGDLAHSLTVNALFDTGRPVMVTPPAVPCGIGRRIAVAWNGSAQCARALGGATNFLPGAEKVTILTAHGDLTPVSVVPDLERYLAHHGVAVETRAFRHEGRKPVGGRRLLEECALIDADLLVMGATKTTRLKELILGSATRDILELATIPVLMGH